MSLETYDRVYACFGKRSIAFNADYDSDTVWTEVVATPDVAAAELHDLTDWANVAGAELSLFSVADAISGFRGAVRMTFANAIELTVVSLISRVALYKTIDCWS